MPLDRASPTQLQFVMSEYNAIRGEVQATLTNQVAVLSFGAAALGLVFAAAASLWDTKPTAVPAGLLLAGVPVVAFLTLAIYSGELIRMMRAGLFLNQLEFAVNESPTLGEPPPVRAGARPPVVEHLLCWEQWSHIRKEGNDIDRINRLCIYAVFVLLTLGSAVMGWWRLQTDAQTKGSWAALALAVSLLIGFASLLWLRTLAKAAYRYRTLYDYNADFPPGARPGADDRKRVRLAKALEPGPLEMVLRRRGGRAVGAGRAPRGPATPGPP